MKKFILICAAFTATQAFAQIPEDALRYSWYPQSGTARNQAIGGAMGSLGGDVTATFVNPAGLGFYKTQEFVFTPSYLMNKNKAQFRGTNSSNTKNNFTLGTSGLIFGIGESEQSKSSHAVSFAYTQTANFNNIIQYKGLNNQSSFSEQFVEEFVSSKLSIDEVLNQNSQLPYTSAPALYTYLIDTTSAGGNLIVKAAPENILNAGQALMQDYYKKTTGGMYELALGAAINDNKHWLFGGTIGIPVVNYTSSTSFTESDTSSNTMNGFKSFKYVDDFSTTGIGFNVKLGAIYRPKEYIRIGLAIHTPSFMWLEDERTTTLNTVLETPSGVAESFNVSSKTFTNGQPGQNKYVQMSPWKAILSGSYVFRETEDVTRQKGFITADIEYVNHQGSRFKNINDEASSRDKSYYKDLNNVIKETYKGTFNLRAGGEMKFNTWMTRLGIAYYGNPYKDVPYKADRLLLSGGLGYRHKGFFVDLTYVHQVTKDANVPYLLSSQANTFATLNQNQGNVIASIGFKF